MSVISAPGCTLAFTDETIEMLVACRAYSTARGLDLVITHGTDGAHSGAADPHPFGKALDIRIHNIPDHEAARAALAQLLGPSYTVIIEDDGTSNEHIHVQLRKDLWPATVPAAQLAAAKAQDAGGRA